MNSAINNATGESTKPTLVSGDKEVYTSPSRIPPPALATPSVTAALSTANSTENLVEEEDDLLAVVAVGTICKRKACGVAFVSDEYNRAGDGKGAICIYHPASPIFREGSKGYLCCKRRVLEFDEFLKIEGCKTGRHIFALRSKPVSEELEEVKCRMDHYQTPTEVHVSVFAKNCDKEHSRVTFDDNQVNKFTDQIILTD